LIRLRRNGWGASPSQKLSQGKEGKDALYLAAARWEPHSGGDGFVW
jgi:hypothetical protein